MNERIEELAKYCGYNGDYCTEDFSLEMFAELIIGECAYIATMNQHQYEPVGLYVLQHFGVE